MIGNKLRSSTAGELWEIESSLKWWQGLESDWQRECEVINQDDQKAERDQKEDNEFNFGNFYLKYEHTSGLQWWSLG